MEFIKANEQIPEIWKVHGSASKRLNLKVQGFVATGRYLKDNDCFEIVDSDGHCTVFERESFHLIEWLDEQGDAMPADLEQRAEAYAHEHCRSCNDRGTEEGCTCSRLEAAYLAGATNHPQPGLVDQLRKDNPYTTDDIDSEIGWDNCCDKLESILKEQGGEEKDVTCVFCEMPCEPAPTKRGWSSVRFGKGLHFDCAGKVVDQGNIIGMKELEDFGKDPTI